MTNIEKPTSTGDDEKRMSVAEWLSIRKEAGKNIDPQRAKNHVDL
jgi:hypothetical protein